VEGLQFIPVMQEKWVLALRAWEVFSDTSSGNQVPFYLMPSLGGGSTLRSYNDFRFHDRNMVVLSAESRWALFTHVDVALFADAGRVASLASEVNFKPLKASYGAGVRLHTRTSTIGRLDVAHGAEGWRFVFTIKDAFRHSRLSGGRTTVIPFVP
jgi:outer membrane protein assembly factor BamA